MWIRIIGSVVAVAALAACQQILTDTSPQPLSTLAGTEWAPFDGPADQFVAFRSDGQVVGSGGCNNFFGSFEQRGRFVTLGPLASTKMACPEPIMSSEQNFFALLEQVRAAEGTWKELTLIGENNEVLATLRRRDWD